MHGLLAAVCGALVTVAFGSAHAQTISIATLPQGSVFHTQGSIIAKVARDKDDVRAVVQPYGGTKAMLEAVEQGLAEFAIDDVNDVVAAARGDAEYKGRPLGNLRMALVLRPTPIGVFVRANSDIRSIADLKGKRFPTGWAAFPLALAQIEAILAGGDLTWKDVRGVPVPELIRAADDFAAGRLDATYFAVGGPKVAEVDATVGGIRFLPVPDTAENLARIRKVRPAFYITTVNPAPHLPGIKEPTSLVTWDNVLIVGKHVADKNVEAVIRSIVDNKPELVKGYPPFAGFDPKAPAKPYPGVDYHPAAQRFYAERGLWPKN